MEKRVLIAIILSMAVLFVYPYLLRRYYPPIQQVQTTSAAPEKTVSTGAATGEETAAPVAGGPGAPTGVEGAAKRVSAVTEERFTVDTPLLRATFSNIGGAVRSWELKKYRTSLAHDAPVENLAAKVVADDSMETVLSVGSSSEVIVFSSDTPEVTVTGDGGAELVLKGATSQGVRVEKTYRFTGTSYLVQTSVKVANGSEEEFDGLVETQLGADLAGKDKTGYHLGPLVDSKDGLMRQKKEESIKSGDTPVKWLGLEDKYFLGALIPKDKTPVSWKSEVLSEKTSSVSLRFPVRLAPGSEAGFSYKAYIGPKEYKRLYAANTGLEGAIQFGYFSFLAKPLLVVLNFFERFLHNYGLAIIILTVLIKIVFYPLTKHSLKSMKDLQKIQPQMAAMKEKYKDDKERMNKELMELYKRQKINPLGGCLPMLLQIPVFIGLYEVLYVAIELRQAPFFLWIHDLSAKDPYYVTPLLMGATMFLQQKMSPSAADPTQAKMMLMMPIVFTFMFLNFPSGLVVYWLVNNVLTIAQQYIIQRTPSTAKA